MVKLLTSDTSEFQGYTPLPPKLYAESLPNDTSGKDVLPPERKWGVLEEGLKSRLQQGKMRKIWLWYILATDSTLEQQHSLISAFPHPHVKLSSYNLCDWAKLLCEVQLWCHDLIILIPSPAARGNHKVTIRGHFGRVSLPPGRFQVSHVTGWKPILFPRVPRLYFTSWSGRTKEQVSPLQHLT